MGIGGYLIWRLHPDYLVLLDGRLEVFGTETFERLWINDFQKFARLDREFRFGTVLTRDHNRPEAAKLLAGWVADPSWRMTYVDDKSAVFVREPTEHEAIDLEAPGLFPPLDASRGALDVHKLNGRIRFYTALDLHTQALAEWERGLEVFPDLSNGETVRRLLRQEVEAAGSRPLR